jgi:hypothetical protein
VVAEACSRACGAETWASCTQGLAGTHLAVHLSVIRPAALAHGYRQGSIFRMEILSRPFEGPAACRHTRRGGKGGRDRMLGWRLRNKEHGSAEPSVS